MPKSTPTAIVAHAVARTTRASIQAARRAGHRGVLQSSGEELRQKLSAPQRNDQPARRAQSRQHESFGHVLSEKIEPARAERQADGRLALPARLAQEQQAGHIRDCDE